MPTTQPGYLIGNLTVSNPELMAEYIRKATPLMRDYDGTMIVSNSSFDPVEGDAQPVLVIIRFPSREHADSFYNAPEYAVLKDLRVKATSGGFFAIVTGLPTDF